MVFQAYIDDSYTPDGVFVLGGYIASAEAWVSFSKQWEEILPHGTLNKHGRYHFKMSEMALNDERMSRVPGFFRIIENNVLAALSCKINIAELHRAKARFFVPNLQIDRDDFANPYFVAFRGMLDMFSSNRSAFGDVIPETEKIDFYFDDQSEKSIILSSWDDYVKNDSDAQQCFGATPRFEDDEDFLPLQAADFWAWWVRKWHEQGMPEKMESCDFGSFEGANENHVAIDISFTEDALANVFKGMLRDAVGPSRIIYDLKFYQSKSS